MRFESPWWLLLLLLLPYFILLVRQSRSGLERGRSVATTILRVLLFIALVLSLADAQWMSRTYRTATIFLLDHSYSIPQEVQARAVGWVNEQLAKLPKNDKAGVVLFGNEAMIEIPPVEKPSSVGPSSVVTRSATDLGAALRLALALFPEGYQRRVVLVSDGNENRGNALAEADMARAHNVTIDIFPLRYDYPVEAWIEALHVPSDVVPREPFEVSVVVNSLQAGPARLTLFQDDELLSVEDVILDRGKNVFAVKQKVQEAGSHAYRAVIEVPGDAVSQNNVAHAFATAHGEARVAVIPGEPKDGETLLAALLKEGLHAVELTPERMMLAASDIAEFDAVVFANVGASQVSRACLRVIESAVHDAGVGFIMVGGERSYGPGGYRGSPVEELLPVTMEQPKRRVIPNGALCLVLHTCEIPQGNFWAKEIGIAALNVLNAQDYMGVLVYSWQSGGSEWLFEMQPVTNKAKLAGFINNANPGDMPDFDSTLDMAHEGLRKFHAGSKHVVVISDADPSGPSLKLVDAMVADKITISTVAIAPHGQSDVQKMARIAKRAGGRFYFVKKPSNLPQIFIKEAATLQRSMIIEGKIPPVVTGTSEALKGISPGEIPMLRGYTLTNPKPLSRMSLGAPVKSEKTDAPPDVLLTEWTYGLGRTMAFTSDAKSRWASDWVGWANYSKFWSQAVRSVLRTVPRSPYAVHTGIEEGRGRVTIEAVDEHGGFLHGLRFRGSATSPRGEKRVLDFRQTAPGRYEAGFDAAEVGVYRVTGFFEGKEGQQGFFSRGVPLSYAPEYRDLKTDETLLDQVRERTGGRRLSPLDPVYAAFPFASGVARPLWPYLLALALILFPIDVFIRRVAIDWGAAVRKSLLVFMRPFRRSASKQAAVSSTLDALARKKEEVRSARFAPPLSDVDLDAMASGKPSTTAASPPPAKAEEKKPAAAPQSEPPEAGDTMSRLLDAKRKARDTKRDNS